MNLEDRNVAFLNSGERAQGPVTAIRVDSVHS